jgi:hypothetical protein
MRRVWREICKVLLQPNLMVDYCATSLMQVPVDGSGIVCAGQQKPQAVTCEGSQQIPLSVMPSLLGQIGTQLPSKFCCPLGQAFPSHGGGHATPYGLFVVLTPTGCGG